MEQKKAFTYEKSSTPTGLVWGTDMAAVSLFWNTNMVPVTSCENALFARVVVNSRLQHPALKFLEKADAMLKSKVDGVGYQAAVPCQPLKGKTRVGLFKITQG